MPDLASFHDLAKTVRLFGSHSSEAALSSRQRSSGALLDRMRRPVIGDLVFEVTKAYRAADDDHVNAVGFLVDEPENATYIIRTLDGRNEKWSNAHFFAIPNEKKVGIVDEVGGKMPLFHTIAKTLRVFGFNAYDAAISPCGKAYDLYQRMKKPVPGDLVFEPGTVFYSSDEDHINAVGYLIESGESKDQHGGNVLQEF